MRILRHTFVGEPLNHIHQDTKSARSIAVCKRSLRVDFQCSEHVNSFIDAYWAHVRNHWKTALSHWSEWRHCLSEWSKWRHQTEKFKCCYLRKCQMSLKNPSVILHWFTQSHWARFKSKLTWNISCFHHSFKC